MKKLSVLLLSFLLLSHLNGFAQRLDLIGHSGGFPNSLTLAFDRLYLSQSLYLKALDVTDNSLSIRGELEIGEEREPAGLIVAGTTGYLVSNTRIYTLNMADPDKPIVRGSLDFGGTRVVNGIALAGNVLVISQQEDGVRMIDVSNPDAPILRSTFAATARDVVAFGTRAYVLDGTTQQVGNGSTNLIVLNVANPASPAELGRIAVPRAGEIVLSGNTAFTVGRGSGQGVRSIDVTNPTAMTVLDSIDFNISTGTFQSAANGAAVQGNRLYVSIGANLKVYDISNRSSLTEIGQLSFEGGRVSTVDVSGTKGGVIVDDRIVLLDLAGGGTPTIEKTINEPSLIHDIVSDENRQYVVDNKGIFCYEIVDESTPPALQGFFSNGSPAGYGAVAARGSLVFALNFFSDTMSVVDFTNPGAPVLRSSTRVGNPASGGEIAVRGNFAYIASAGGSGAKIVDVSNPAAPVIRATHSLATAASQALALYVPPTGSLIVVQGGTLGSEPKELEIVDVSNPAAPVRRAVITEAQIHGFAVEGNLLVYGFDRNAPKIKVMDITNPSNPQKRSEFLLNTPPVWELEVIDSVIIASIPGGSVHGYSVDPLPTGRDVFSFETPESSELSVSKPGDDPFLITVAGGYSDHESGYSYGSKGKFDLSARLSSSEGESTLTTAVDSADGLISLFDVTEENPRRITSITLGANQTRDVLIQSLTFGSKGTIDEAFHVKRAFLFKGDSLLSTATFANDNSRISFALGRTIKAGQSEKLDLFFEFDTVAMDCPIRDRSGNILQTVPTANISFEPQSGDIISAGSLFDSKVASAQSSADTSDPQVVSSPSNSGFLAFGCVENQSTGKPFNDIQIAIGDNDVKDGHSVVVAPGKYPGPILINKMVSIRGDVVRREVLVKPNRFFVQSMLDIIAIAVCTGGVSLEDLTIGNNDGDNRSGKGIKVGSCGNGSDFVSSVTVEGVTFQNLVLGLDASRAVNFGVKRCRFRNCVTGAEFAETILGVFTGNTFVQNVNGVRIIHGVGNSMATSRFIFNSGVAVDGFLDTNTMSYYDIDGKRIAYSDSHGNLIIENEFIDNGGEKGNRTEKEEDVSIAGGGDPNSLILREMSGGVIGNRFVEDSVDAVFLTEGANPFFRSNLFVSSHGFALNNGDPSVIIDARENWWGDPSGPSGAGPGSGDEVSANVDFADWLEEEIGLVAVAQADTIFVPKGAEDAFHIFLQNWKVRDDKIDVNVTDDLGWLKNGGSTRKELIDSVGAEHQVELAVPNVAEETVNVVRYTATSSTNASDRESDSVVLISYSPEMFALGISPGDTVRLDRGDTTQFYILGIDQRGRPADIGTVGWEADGGTISVGGQYIAGLTDGLFEVRGRANGFTAPGYVRIGDVSTSVRETAIAGERVGARLIDASPNPFATNATVRFALAKAGIVSFTLHNLQGEEVAAFHSRLFEAGENEITLNAESLESGLYYLRLRSSEGTSVLKVMVVR